MITDQYLRGTLLTIWGSGTGNNPPRHISFHFQHVGGYNLILFGRGTTNIPHPQNNTKAKKDKKRASPLPPLPIGLLKLSVSSRFFLAFDGSFRTFGMVGTSQSEHSSCVGLVRGSKKKDTTVGYARKAEYSRK
jgi:hypothetical protein